MTSVSVAPSPRSFRKRLLFSAMLVGFGLLLAVLVLETAGRLVFPRYGDPAQFYSALEESVLRSGAILEVDRKPGAVDEKFGFALSPNASSTQTRPEFTITYTTNSLGYRTHEPAPRAPDEYRVMMIGDSFFYGEGLQQDETIGAQLERIAAEDSACERPLKVYNFGHPGYCTVQELVVLRTHAAKIAPDHVILGFFAANDMLANALSRIDEDGNFAPDTARVAKYRADLESSLGLVGLSFIGRVAASSSPGLGRIFSDLANRPDYLEPNLRWLTTFRDDCKAAGYRYGVVFQHTKDTVIDGWRSHLYSGRELTRKLTAFCDREAIPRVEMLDVLRDGRPWQDYLYPIDAHPRPLGARKTAEAIYQALLQQHLHRSVPAKTSSAGR